MRRFARFRAKGRRLVAAAVSANLSLEPVSICTDRKHGALFIIALHEAWCVFAMQLVFDSAFGKAKTASGVPLVPILGCRSRGDLMSVMSRRKIKERWNQASEVIDIAKRLGLANAHTIGGALGDARAASLADLRKVRNTIVHPNEKSLAEFRKLLARDRLPKALSAIDYTYTKVGAGTRLETWLWNLELVAEAAVQ